MERRNFFKAAAFSAAAATPVLGMSALNNKESVLEECAEKCCFDSEWESRQYTNTHIQLDNSNVTKDCLMSAVDMGIDRNLIVFDECAMGSTISKRLVYLMLEVQNNTYGDLLYHMYIPSGSAYTEEFDVFNDRVFGISFTATPFLNEYSELMGYYESVMHGFLPSNKYSLAVGISPSGPILGAI